MLREEFPQIHHINQFIEPVHNQNSVLKAAPVFG